MPENVSPLYTKIRYDELQNLYRELAYYKMKCEMKEKRISQLNDKINELRK